MEFGNPNPTPVLEEVREGPVWEQEQFELLPENRIVVPEVLDRPRKAIRLTAKSLRRKRTAYERDPVVGAKGIGCLDVAVSRDLIDRSMRIMQALLDACEARGWVITPGTDDETRTVIALLGQSVAIGLSERSQRTEHTSTKPSRPGQLAPLWTPRFDYLPTGQLVLRIETPYGSRIRQSWSDGKRQRVEDMLNEVMVSLVTVAVAERAAKEEAARREGEWQEEQRVRAEWERERVLAEAQLKQLREDAESWRTAQRIREFIIAAEMEGAARASAGSHDVELLAWLTWARAVADGIDPLRQQELGQYLVRDPTPRYSWERV